MTEEQIQRLKDAIEGECDGLAITDAHAKAILEYVLDNPPESAAVPADYAEAEQDTFCDAFCTWRDHHPECQRAALAAAPRSDLSTLPRYSHFCGMFEAPHGEYVRYSDVSQLFAAAPAAPSEPAGWKLVPIEPTEEMIEAGMSRMRHDGTTEVFYRAMLAAAPEAPQQSPDELEVTAADLEAIRRFKLEQEGEAPEAPQQEAPRAALPEPKIVEYVGGGTYEHIGTADPAGTAKGNFPVEVYRGSDGLFWYRYSDDFAERMRPQT